MGTNVATNFPPQTYSSSFFLNTLTDDVGVSSNSSKKRVRNSENAESSSAVLDCFITTMFSHIHHVHYTCTILVLVVLHLSECADIVKYDCLEGVKPEIRTFFSINDYQKNTLHFNSKYNYVDFNISSMTHLEKNVFITYESNYVRKLILNDKRIETIDVGAFSELFCVKYLFLQNNLISQLDNGTFDGLYSLEELNLNENNIMTIPDGSFRNLKHLIKLYLSRNKILYMSQGVFDSLSSLWELRLDNNALSTISSDLFRNTSHLKRLHLGHNLIATPAGTDFKYLEHLDFLDLSSNMISALTEQLFRSLGRLSELNLAGNQLTKLNVHSLPILQRIHLQNNQWQCVDLKSILKELQQANIGVVIDKNTLYNNIELSEIGCLNGSEAWTTSTTTTYRPLYPSAAPRRPVMPTVPAEIPYVTPAARADDSDHGDDHSSEGKEQQEEEDSVVLAINQLKTLVILFLTVIIVLAAVYYANKLGSCSRFRRRYTAAGSTEASLPLLLR